MLGGVLNIFQIIRSFRIMRIVRIIPSLRTGLSFGGSLCHHRMPRGMMCLFPAAKTQRH
jgi:hypothetical protein